jgi:hypothetical protein
MAEIGKIGSQIVNQNYQTKKAQPKKVTPLIRYEAEMTTL